MTKSDYIMGKMPYKKALWKLAWPAIFTFLVMSAYITIDRILIARFVGPEGMGAMQYVGLSSNLIAALSTVVAVGTKVNFSIMLGRKENNKVSSLLANSYVLMIIVGFVLMFATYFIGPAIASSFNAPTKLTALATKYYQIFAIGIFAQSIVYLFESIFQAKGYNRMILWFTLISQLLNLSLDIILMKHLNLGISGAALATAISMYVNMFLILSYVIFIKKEFLINVFKYKMKMRNIRKILRIGMPAMTESLMLSIKIVIFTFWITKIGSQEDIIAYSAARTAWVVILIPVFGLSYAGGPMIGYNYGSKNFQRLKNISIYKYKILKWYFFTTFIFIMFYPQALLSLFNIPQYTNSSYIIRIISIGTLFIARPITWGSVFQNTGLTREKLIMSLFRNVVIFIPIVTIFALFLNLKILLVALPIADIAGIIFTDFYVARQIKKDKYKHLKIFDKSV